MIFPNFPKNCMKLKEFGPSGASLAPSRIRHFSIARMTKSVEVLHQKSNVTYDFEKKGYTVADPGLFRRERGLPTPDMRAKTYYLGRILLKTA